MTELFSREELTGARVRYYSRWNGETSYLTNNCSTCPFHLTDDGNGNETCEWGVAWKRLIPRPRGEKTCALLKMGSPRAKAILRQRSRQSIL